MQQKLMTSKCFVSQVFIVFKAVFGKVGYTALFEDKLKNCDDFENSAMDLSGLMLVPMGLNTSLCGIVTFGEDIIEENNVNYAALFEGPFKSCEGFDNSKVIDCSNLGFDSSSVTDTCLKGHVDLNKSITEDEKMKIDIYQCGDMVDEQMMTFEGSICDQLQETDTPWYPVFEAMGIQKCPITEGRYSCSKMTLDLSSAQPYMTHEYVGLYKIIITIFTNDANRTKIACLVVYVGVVEINDDE